jgi:hypothetical protein
VRSARFAVSFLLAPDDPSRAIRKGFSLALVGAFQSARPGFPDVAVSLTVHNYGTTVRTGLASVGGRVFIATAGHWYATDAATADALRSGFGGVVGGDETVSSLLGPLTAGARRWLTHPRITGRSSVEGTPTETIRAGVDVGALLHALGGPNGVATAMLGPTLSSALVGAVREPRVVIETGASDHILRRLTASAAIVSTAATRSLLAGPGSRLSASLALSAIGAPQRISVPAHPLPSGKLAEALRRSGGLKVSSAG